jgi:hypothetical protein
MINRKGLLAGVALLAGGGIAAAMGPALPAIGQASPPSTPLIVRSTAKVIDRGAVAQPTLLVACQPGDLAFVSISLSERSGKLIASGSNGEEITCSGGIETIKLSVTPQLAPFVAGKAFGQASLQDCNPVNCIMTNVDKTITLNVVKKK